MIKLEYHSVVKDPVLPGLVYILTMALSGSILVRRRSLPVRFVVPSVIGMGAVNYYMPNTFDALVKKYDALEGDNFPELQKERYALVEKCKELKKQADEELVQANKSLEGGVHDLREAIKNIWS